MQNARIVVGDQAFDKVAKTFKNDYRDLTGREIEIVTGTKKTLQDGDIFLEKVGKDEMLGEEGYYLNIGGPQAKQSGKSYADVKKLAEQLGDAPNADFMYEVDKEVIDHELLKLNGKESYLSTDIKSPGFDWTTAMWINPETDGNGILMEGKTGTLRLEDGKLKYQIEGYTHTFDCVIPSGKWTHITLTGTFEGVALYINGQNYPVNEKGEQTQRYYESDCRKLSQCKYRRRSFRQQVGGRRFGKQMGI